MNSIVAIAGGWSGMAEGLAEALRQCSLDIVSGGEGNDVAAADMLVNLAVEAGQAVASTSAFAEVSRSAGADRLVVNILPAAAASDWPANREAAILAAFTRYSALAWAPKHIRVNGVILAQPTRLAKQETADFTVQNMAATMLAFRRWRSFTGQVIRLAA